MTARNQLSEGVGKKIVEALKRQAEADITPIEDSNNVISNSIPLNDEETAEEPNFNSFIEEASVSNEYIIEEEIPAKEEAIQTSSEEESFEQERQPVFEGKQQAPVKTRTFDFSEQTVVKKDKLKKAAPIINVKIPSNVAILKNLISTLPAGVSKQTGAQIIRQTIEAMGLPMNSVLKEAQEVQEELNTSVKECMLKVQEYKTNILQLEQSVQEYQKNVSQLDDLVSLFLLTDKNN